MIKEQKGKEIENLEKEEKRRREEYEKNGERLIGKNGIKKFNLHLILTI